MYIVSSCLLGVKCKYNGESNYTKEVEEALEGHNYISLCPEEVGGFPTPRPPAELRDGRVYNNKGEDVTDQFNLGAERSLQMAREKAEELGELIEKAILKAKSPTCGKGPIYDGNFNGTLVEGQGVFAKLLTDNEIQVLSEEDVK